MITIRVMPIVRNVAFCFERCRYIQCLECFAENRKTCECCQSTLELFGSSVAGCIRSSTGFGRSHIWKREICGTYVDCVLWLTSWSKLDRLHCFSTQSTKHARIVNELMTNIATVLSEPANNASPSGSLSHSLSQAHSVRPTAVPKPHFQQRIDSTKRITLGFSRIWINVKMAPPGTRCITFDGCCSSHWEWDVEIWSNEILIIFLYSFWRVQTETGRTKVFAFYLISNEIQCRNNRPYIKELIRAAFAVCRSCLREPSTFKPASSTEHAAGRVT